MADLAGRPARTVERAAVEHQRPADPGSHPHTQDIVDVAGCTGDPFAQQTQVHIVAQSNRHIQQRFQLRAQVHLVDPVRQIRNRQHFAFMNDAWDPNAYRDWRLIQRSHQIYDIHCDESNCCRPGHPEQYRYQAQPQQ